jgi:hypothetical protein
MSTDGRGEAWLHIRLDTKPKYTKCVEFRNPSAASSPANQPIPKPSEKNKNPIISTEPVSRTTINQDKLSVKITAMRNYGEVLDRKGVSKGLVAMKLATELELMAKKFFALSPEERDEAKFKEEFLILLRRENQQMSAYRIAWGTIVANIAIALTGIGLLLIAGQLIHSKATGKRALFFFQKSKTTSEEKIANIEQMFAPKKMS